MRCGSASSRGSDSNVGGPWWADFIETVSEFSRKTEDLFERVDEESREYSKNS